MLTRNVHYSEQPESVIVTSNNRDAIVELPIDVREIEIEETDGIRTEWIADKVYFVKVRATKNLKERVENNYDSWLALAKEPEVQTTTIEDLVDAINVLQDLILEGSDN